MSITLLPQPTPQRTASQPPRLLDQVAQAALHRGASEPTTAQLVAWVRAYVLFHGKRHPRELDRAAVSRFLEHVVRTEKEPLPALESARSALELLYGTVLGIDLGELPRPRPSLHHLDRQRFGRLSLAGLFLSRCDQCGQCPHTPPPALDRTVARSHNVSSSVSSRTIWHTEPAADRGLGRIAQQRHRQGGRIEKTGGGSTCGCGTPTPRTTSR